MFDFSPFKDFDRLLVGIDSQFDKLNKMHDVLSKTSPSYPPYNIRKVDDTNYVVELAVAGFTKNDIQIEVDGDTLLIKGNVGSDQDSGWVYKGIANRSFTRVFGLADGVEVVKADLENGLLSIRLEKQTPTPSTKHIPIGDGSIYSGSKQSLLTE